MSALTSWFSGQLGWALGLADLLESSFFAISSCRFITIPQTVAADPTDNMTTPSLTTRSAHRVGLFAV